MDASLLLLLKQTITIEPASGMDAYGQSSYGTGVSVPARVEGRNRVVVDAQGNNAVSSTTIYVDGPTVVTTSSRITLPDGTTPLILSIESMPDIDGTPHHKVIFT